MTKPDERTVLHMLEANPYRSDWDDWHELIADWHIDSRGHRVCGCSLHQARCDECTPARLLPDPPGDT